MITLTESKPDYRTNPELSTEEKLLTRIKNLPPGKCLKYIVITGPDGEVLAYCETEIGKSVSS
ncbi:hypothetical protein [Caudoviricetes sp.]|nr:hypothetical protein [Caudoviricetes sp.]UOF81133.1 hypothetical protein [Caudoviricetes sp.]UOF82231.1 hypothetical protein [Caudoviricetes sp.]UOF82478.1 hypothetical protein [Caudoviricetes sp.]UOF82632.1 hypothetical protein [Caudoviricetes sp.]